MTARLLCSVYALACCLAATVAHGEDPATVALNFQDVDLPVVARFVSETTGRNFILDDRVRGRITIISPTPIAPNEAYRAFQAALAVKGFTTIESGAFVKIVPMREARPPTGSTTAGPDDVVTRIITLRHADVTSLEPVLMPLVSPEGVLTAHADSRRIIVVDTAANVERIAGLASALDHTSARDATQLIRLEHAAAEALAIRLGEALGATEIVIVPEPRANALLISGEPDGVERARRMVAALDVQRGPGQGGLHVHRLQHASAERLVVVLSQLLGLPAPQPATTMPTGGAPLRMASAAPDDGERPAAPMPISAGTGPAVALDGPVRITADPSINALLVSATDRDWRTIRHVLGELDIPRRQVFVEAIILEATIEKTRQLGIELQGAGTAGNEIGFGQVNLASLGPAIADPTSLPGLILAAASNDTVTLPNGTEVPAHTVLLTALQTDGELDVLSAPTIVTTDNEEAEIVVGRNVPFVASRATDATNLENLFTTIERQDVGITLRMTPQILADDYVRLTLYEEVSDIDETTTAALGDPSLVGPTTTIRSTSTVVAARHGQTVVIGGLLADAVRVSERSVPFVSRIPVLGNLFRHRAQRRVKTNLLVFLTPHVIHSDAAYAARSAAQRAAFPPKTPHREVLSGPTWTAPEERQ